ncbi:hypothetical protein E2C01_093435 [Portunus trituberculatus]|uniref:Uncharacterized protein n=1 Tax=Portunus trituberculatus TaxID=210409 RepID=A0A5B7K0H7_PORTR|nr:hypothetical protein [Portunus trituberculatus]
MKRSERRLTPRPCPTRQRTSPTPNTPASNTSQVRQTLLLLPHLLVIARDPTERKRRPREAGGTEEDAEDEEDGRGGGEWEESLSGAWGEGEGEIRRERRGRRVLAGLPGTVIDGCLG